MDHKAVQNASPLVTSLARFFGKGRKAKAKHLQQIADAARDAKDWNGAACGYEQVLALLPQRSDLWVQYGHALKESGRGDDAVAAYRQAIAVAPADSDAVLHLAHLLKSLGRRTEAIHAFIALGRLGAQAEADFYLRELDAEYPDGAASRAGSSKSHGISSSPALPRECFIPAEAQEGGPCYGRIEQVRQDRVVGWAIDTSREGPAEVELLVDGVIIQRQRTGTLRRDVERLYPGHELSGFEFSVMLDGITAATATIDVRIAGTSFYLQGKHGWQRGPGPWHVERRQLPIASQAVSIVVPVYNAAAELKQCIESVIRHTSLGDTAHQLILSDDASPDPAVEAVLTDYEGRDGFIVLRHAANIGYTGNVNQAIAVARSRAPDADIVLLNSDTRVTPQWLQLIQRCAMQRPSIGTVSPISDNAGAFSVPVRNAANDIPQWLTEDDHARLITQSSGLQQLPVPTTSGFCMYIKRGLLDDIGLFDEDSFPRGYGEENDFCMRAARAGWENVVADNVIIYHERSASFQATKGPLIQRSSEIINAKYPEYGRAVHYAFRQRPEMNWMRYNVARAQLRHEQRPRPRVAYVIGVESGGTPQTNMDLMSSVQEEYEPYLLLCNTRAIQIFRIVGRERQEIEKIVLRHPVMPFDHDSDSYREEISDILQRYAIELVHIRHIGRHGVSLIRIARQMQIPVILSIHDFYTICPNVKLLDAYNRFCGGVCTDGNRDCTVELWDTRYTPALKHAWVKSWQKMFADVLPLCDALITTSPYARDLVRSFYPLGDVPFEIIPHARDFDSFSQLAASVEPGERLRIFVPGHLVPAKGLDLIREIKARDFDDLIEFHFAGQSPADLSPYGVFHGAYRREDFHKLVASIKPHVGAVLSIWPETYSHTLTELWSCGVPVITSNLGATGERVSEHGGGWALPEMDAQNIYDLLMRLMEEPELLADRREEVARWQAGYGQDYSIAIMAEQYKRLYSRSLTAQGMTRREVMVIPVGDTPAGTPVAHLRDIFDQGGGFTHLMAWPSRTLAVLEKIEPPAELIIKYHGEPEDADAVRAALEQMPACWPGTSLALELAANVEPFEAWGERLGERPLLAWLLENAGRVIAPVEMITGAHLPEVMPLNDVVSDDKDLDKLPDLDSPRSGFAPVSALDYMPDIARRMDREVLPGSSAHIFRHNAPLVAANFTLIDWEAMLARPRVSGLVSLVMPSFNRVGMTEKFLNSILSATRGKLMFEVIVVDNGSKPEVRDQIRRLDGVDPRVKVVCTTAPLMFAVGCNYGASFARGEYILFVNNDMEAIEANWLDSLIAPLQASPTIGITGGMLLFEDRTVQHAGLVFSDRSNFAYHAYLGHDPQAEYVRKMRRMQAVTGACMAMRASDWAKLRGFNPLYLNGCEDVDLCLRMKSVLKRDSLYVPDSVLIHYEGKTPGRGRYIIANRKIFSALWAETFVPDDQALYKSDGIEEVYHQSNDEWLAPGLQTVSVSFETRKTMEAAAP